MGKHNIHGVLIRTKKQGENLHNTRTQGKHVKENKSGSRKMIVI